MAPARCLAPRPIDRLIYVMAVLAWAAADAETAPPLMRLRPEPSITFRCLHTACRLSLSREP